MFIDRGAPIRCMALGILPPVLSRQRRPLAGSLQQILRQAGGQSQTERMILF